MVGWVSRSLKHKAFILLVLLSIIPLLVSGITINVLTNSLLEQKTNYWANQTIDKLSVSMSKDLQGFVDMVFYHSRNQRIIDLLSMPVTSDTDRLSIYYGLSNEILGNGVVRRVNYPFHYIVVTREGEIFTNFSYVPQKDRPGIMEDMRKSEWYKTLSGSLPSQIIIESHANYLSPRGEMQLYIAGNIIRNSDNIGVIAIGIDKYYASRLLDNVKVSERSSLYIINSSSECIVEGEDNYYKFKDIPGEIVASAVNSNKVSSFAKIDGSDQFVTCSELYIRGMDDMWKVVVVTPTADIHKDIYYINYVISGMMLISLVGILLLVLLLNKHIINPILLLNTFAKEVEGGNLEVRAQETRQDEIGQLGHGLNDMLVNLKRHIANVKEKERLKSKLEISILQSQINPHFIRNTLNVIRWMAELLNVPSISKAIISFIRILDYYLGSPDVMVTVQKEMECLNEYIYLQKLKYQNKFSAAIDIDEGIMDYPILKLILQPIVENSIIHGLDKKKGLGSLSIKGFKNDGKLTFIIKDDGIGMDEKTLENIFELKPSSQHHAGIGGIGIANVEQRIHLYYGGNYGLTLSSVLEEGTEVVVTIPAVTPGNKGGGTNENTDS